MSKSASIRLDPETEATLERVKFNTGIPKKRLIADAIAYKFASYQKHDLRKPKR